MENRFNILKPQIGDVVQITSDSWYVWNGNMWRPMATEEQIEASK